MASDQSENEDPSRCIQNKSIHIIRRISQFFTQSSTEKENQMNPSVLQRREQTYKMDEETENYSQESLLKPIYTYCIQPNPKAPATKAPEGLPSRLFTSLKSFRRRGKGAEVGDIQSDVNDVKTNVRTKPLATKYVSMDDDDDDDDEHDDDENMLELHSDEHNGYMFEKCSEKQELLYGSNDTVGCDKGMAHLEMC